MTMRENGEKLKKNDMKLSVVLKVDLDIYKRMLKKNYFDFYTYFFKTT